MQHQNEKERQEAMEREEKKATLIDLIKSFGWVFLHPILREWVQVAPSVNSIDRFVCEQFRDFEHKIELVKAMRAAVKIWQVMKDGQAKKELLKLPEGSRLADMFLFGDQFDFPGEHKDDGLLCFSSFLRFLPDTKKIVDSSNWPLLLKEFCSRGESFIKTSVDRAGRNAGRFLFCKEINEEFWSQLVPRKIFYGFDNDNRYKLSFGGEKGVGFDQCVWAEFIFNKVGIHSQIVEVGPGTGEVYSRFFKALSLWDATGCSIEVLWPIDCVRGGKKGKLSFSKSIGIGHKHLGLELRLDFTFRQNQDFKLVISPEHSIPTSCSFISLRGSGSQQNLMFQQGSPSPDTRKVSDAMAILYEDLLAIWKYCVEQQISLEAILGGAMLKSPPSDLLKLFTG